MNCRTIRYAKSGGVEIVETKVTDPQPGEVQVQSLACGVCAWDIHVFKSGSDSSAPAGHWPAAAR